MNQDARATFNVALINPAEIIEEIFSLARDYNLQAFFPEIHIHAMTKHGLDKGHISRLNAAGIKTYSDHRTLLEDNPQIDTIILLSNDPRLHHELHSEHSDDEITIIDYRAAKFMWEIIVQERLCLSCQTHLSHAQNLLRAILDEVREDILLLDLDKNIVDVNKNVYSRLGKTKDELIGRKCWETWSPNGEVCGTESYPCPFDTVIKTGQKAEALHTRVDKEGRLSYFRIYIYPIRNTQDKITHLVEMRRDITSRTYMEKKLQQSEKLVAIGELSTYIAHEIRNPLFAIG
ncbi:MAG: PAS domain-containing protein, partial [Desulfonatronovibrionaceae bacterium]